MVGLSLVGKEGIRTVIEYNNPFVVILKNTRILLNTKHTRNGPFKKWGTVKNIFLSETFFEQSLLVIVKSDQNKLLLMKMPEKHPTKCMSCTGEFFSIIPNYFAVP